MYSAQNINGDLLSLAAGFQQIAVELYDTNGKPRLDRSVILSSQPNAREILFPVEGGRFCADSSSLINFPEKAREILQSQKKEESFFVFLSENDVKALSVFRHGSSAQTLIGWKADDDAVVIRVPKTQDAMRHLRTDTPIVVQPLDTLKMSPDSAVNIEILPFMPVLPNRGILMRDDIPGHSTARFGEFVVVGTDGYRQEVAMPYFDNCMASLTAVLHTVGYEIEAPRDIALFPDGTPVFVDPETISITDSHFPPERPYNLLLSYMNEYVGRNLFNWLQTKKPAVQNGYERKEKSFHFV